MSEELRKQIRSNFQLRDTYDLLEIWKANDRREWSDTAFEELRNVLFERIGTVLPQDEPILGTAQESDEDGGLEEWEEKLLEDENQPELYDPLEALGLIDNINRIAVAAVIVNIVLGLMYFRSLIVVLPRIDFRLNDSLIFGIGDQAWNIIYWLLTVGLKAAVTYFPLKALAHILRILMQMEFNSRTSVPIEYKTSVVS